MKKAIFLFTLFAGFHSLNAQSWFKDNPHWANFFSFGFAGAGYEYVSVQGDTVLQGLPATKLERFRDLPSNGSTDIRIARQHGDTIWLWNANTNQFHIAYNFSLAVGDSVAVPLYWGGGDFKYSIDSVGTLMIDGQPLRFQRISFSLPNLLNAQYHSLFIENIGFINGSYPNPPTQNFYGGHFFMDERNEGFVDGHEWAFCQYHNDHLDFADPIDLCAELTSQREPISTTSFSIQPNPFHDAFSLMAKENQAVLYLRIFDAAGRLVGQVSPPFVSVSTSALIPGLYFLEITLKNGNKQFCKAMKE